MLFLQNETNLHLQGYRSLRESTSGKWGFSLHSVVTQSKYICHVCCLSAQLNSTHILANLAAIKAECNVYRHRTCSGNALDSGNTQGCCRVFPTGCVDSRRVPTDVYLSLDVPMEGQSKEHQRVQCESYLLRCHLGSSRELTRRLARREWEICS